MLDETTSRSCDGAPRPQPLDAARTLRGRDVDRHPHSTLESRLNCRGSRTGASWHAGAPSDMGKKEWRPLTSGASDGPDSTARPIPSRLPRRMRRRDNGRIREIARSGMFAAIALRGSVAGTDRSAPHSTGSMPANRAICRGRVSRAVQAQQSARATNTGAQTFHKPPAGVLLSFTHNQLLMAKKWLGTQKRLSSGRDLWRAG